MRRICLLTTVGGLLFTSSDSLYGQESTVDLEAVLTRVGAQLLNRYQLSHRIVSTETVWSRSFTHSMRSGGPVQRLEFERRVEWTPPKGERLPSVTVFRELQLVNGREPQRHELDACLIPPPETEDPLSVLLPIRQKEFEFSLGDSEWTDGRRVVQLEFVPLVEGPAEVNWDEDCVSILLSGRSAGRVWVEVESGDVLRLDEYLIGEFNFREPANRAWSRSGWITLERDDRSIRYERVVFDKPVEVMMLPRSIERSWVLRGNGSVPRYHRSQEFSNHRRFVTGGRLLSGTRIIVEPEAR